MPTVDPATGLRKQSRPFDPATGLVHDKPSEFKRGLRAGMHQLSSIGSGIQGQVAAFAGEEEAADEFTEQSVLEAQAAAEQGPTISKIEEIRNIEDFGDYAAGAIGTQLPIMTTMLAGGPGGILAKNIVKRATQKAILSNQAAAAVGVIGSGTAIESGSIFSQLNIDPEARRGMSHRERAATALGFGTAAGALEALPAINIFRKFGVGKAAGRAIEKSLLKKIGKGAIEQGVLEAGTEGAQTVIERSALKFANENKEIFGEEGISEIKNAIAAGGLTGFLMGGAGTGIASLAEGDFGVRDALSEKFKDLEAKDELLGAGLRGNLGKFREKFLETDPDAVTEIDRILDTDLSDPANRAQGIKFSRGIGDLEVASKLAEEFAVDPDKVTTTDVRAVMDLADNPEGITPEVNARLNELFTDASGLMEGISKQLGVRKTDFEKEDVAEHLTGLFDEETGAAELGVDFTKPPEFINKFDDRKTPGFTVKAEDTLSSESIGKELLKIKRTEGFVETDIIEEGEKVESGGFVYSAAPASEAVLQQASEAGKTVRKGGDLSVEQLYSAAAKRLLSVKSDKELFKALPVGSRTAEDLRAFKESATTNPKAFLDNFKVLRREKIGQVMSQLPEEKRQLSKKDIAISTEKGVKDTPVRVIPKEGLSGARAEAETMLFKIETDAEGKITKRPKKGDVSNKTVNFPSLVKVMLNKFQEVGRSHPSPRNVAFAVVEGVKSLAVDHNMVPSMSTLPDTTVMFIDTKGNKITWKQVKDQLKTKPEKASEEDIETQKDFEFLMSEFDELLEPVQAGVQILGETEKVTTVRDPAAEAQRVTGDKAVDVAEAALKEKVRAAKEKEFIPKKKVAPKKKGVKRSVSPISIKKGAPTHPAAVQEKLSEWASKYKVRLPILINKEEADAHYKRITGEPVPLGVEGFMNGDARILYVNPELSVDHQLRVLAHEFGHFVFEQVADRVSVNDQKLLTEDFLKWRDAALREDSRALAFARKRAVSFDHALSILGGPTERISKMSAEEREYLLDFEEWFADNVSKALNRKTTPKNAIEAFFTKVVGILEKIYLDLSPANSVEQLLIDMSNKRRHNIFASAVIAFQNKVQKSGFKFSKNFEKRLFEDEGLAAYMMEHDPYSDSARAYIAKYIQKALTREERAILTAALSTGQSRKLIEEISGGFDVDAAGSLATGLQLWMLGKIKVGPKSNNVFQQHMETLGENLGYIRRHKQAEALMAALLDARITTIPDERTFRIKELYKDDLMARAGKATFNYVKQAMPYLRAFGFTADSRMQGIPAFKKMASMFNARVGTEGVGESFFAASTRWRGRFNDELSVIVRGLTNEEKANVLEYAQNEYSGKKLSDKEAKAAKQLRTLLDEMFTYMKERDVSVSRQVKDGGDVIRKLRNYFPRVYDFHYLQENKDQFVKMLSLPKYKKFVREAGGAERIYQSLIESEGYEDSAERTAMQFTPGMSSVNKRVLWWLKEADIQPFLNTSLDFTMTRYIDTAVKRAEYTKRFGTDSEVLRELFDQAEKGGASRDDLAAGHAYVEAMMGTIGRETNTKLHALFGAAPPPGQVINPTLQKAMSSVIVLRNLAVLGLTTFTSLADPIGIAVRGGDLDVITTSLKTGLNEIKNGVSNIGVDPDKMTRSEIHKLAQSLGVIDLHITNEALEWQYGGTYMSKWQKKINEGFFRLTMLTQLTQTTRVMALAGAKEFLKKHADGKYNKNSARFLKQLNLQPGDVKLAKDGSVMVMTREEQKYASKKEQERDERVRVALTRFVDEAILRPNAAQRPIWASDPHFMLIFHLKSFMYAFHDRILRRVLTEYKAGNIAPAMTVMAFVPAMMAIDIARDWIKYLGGDNPRKANWTFNDYVLEGIERSGIAGVGGQMILDAKDDTEFGSPFFKNQLGAMSFPIDIAGDVSKGLPVNSVWRHWE